MSMSVNLTNWTVIYARNDFNNTNKFYKFLREVCGPLGMQLNEPNWIELSRSRDNDFIQALTSSGGVQIVVVIMPSTSSEFYSKVKKYLSVSLGVPSQFAMSKTLSSDKKIKSIATKIAIQMNCKLGGVPWGVNIPFKGGMVVGYDAYHDSVTKGNSFGATVSSYTDHFTQYLGQTRMNKGFQELSNSFLSQAKNAIEKYVQVNEEPPKFIIVYRDGVGDGQLDHVKNHEIAAIKNCFKYKDKVPKLLFIVVSKRINARFFEVPHGKGPNAETVNPKAGTVIDDVVTQPERYDFYLISQNVREGTVSPTSYNILEDTIGWSPDRIQLLTYKMTHLYYNWQGTVRVPAPCLYAHKLAYISGTAIHDPAHKRLGDKLW